MKLYSVLCLVTSIVLTACVSLPPTFEPKTPDEQAIVQLMQMLESGYNTGDVEMQLTPYAADAVIETLLLEGRAVSRDQYAKAMRAWTRRNPIEIRPVAINVQTADRAEAVALVRRAPSEGGEILGRRSYRLVRREGQWRIIEARYSR